MAAVTMTQPLPNRIPGTLASDSTPHAMGPCAAGEPARPDEQRERGRKLANAECAQGRADQVGPAEMIEIIRDAERVVGVGGRAVAHIAEALMALLRQSGTQRGRTAG